jgi:hypothetical protein
MEKIVTTTTTVLRSWTRAEFLAALGITDEGLIEMGFTPSGEEVYVKTVNYRNHTVT